MHSQFRLYPFKKNKSLNGLMAIHKQTNQFIQFILHACN